MADEVERINRWDTLAMTDGTWKIGTILKTADGQHEFQPKGERTTEMVPVAKVKEVQHKGLPVLVCTLATIGCYGMTLAPVTWVLISEIFPNRIRGAAVSI